MLAKLPVLFLAIFIAFTANCGWAKPHNQPYWASDDVIWDDLRDDFRWYRAAEHPAVTKQVQWFRKHPGAVTYAIQKAAPYLYFIFEEIHKRDMPAEIALIPMIESAYNPFAYSQVGAAGLWQFMPKTAKIFGLKQNWWYDGRRDVFASTKAALDYLEYLHNFFDGDWLLAVAAYDSGEGTIQHAIRRNEKKGGKTDFWSLGLPKETHVYIPRLLALAEVITHADRYGITLPPVANQPYLKKVNIGSQIDLVHAAKMAGLKLKEMYALNPGFNHWATDPNGPHRLVLPIHKVANFKKKLAKLPKNKRVTWIRHKVKSGETLGSIAHKYHTQTKLVKAVNNKKSHLIRENETLLIPKSAHSLATLHLMSIKKHYRSHNRSKKYKTKHYTVRKGDSLWKIAHRYQIHVKDIRKWNHLGKKRVVKPGQKLTLKLQHI